MSAQVPLPAQQGQPDHGQEDSTGVCQTLQTVGTLPAARIPGIFHLICGFPCLSQAFASLWKKSQQATGVWTGSAVSQSFW